MGTEYTAGAGDIAGAVVSYLATGRRVETVKLHALLCLIQGCHLVSFDAPGTPIVDVVGTFPVLTDPVPALGAPLWRVIERLSAVLDPDAGFTVRDGRCVADIAR